MSRSRGDSLRPAATISSRSLDQNETSLLEGFAGSVQKRRPLNRIIGLVFGIIAIASALVLQGFGSSYTSRIVTKIGSVKLPYVLSLYVSNGSFAQAMESLTVIVLAAIGFHYSRASRDNSIQRMIQKGTASELVGDFVGKITWGVKIGNVRLRCASRGDGGKVQKSMGAGQNRLVLTECVKNKDSILLSVNGAVFQKPMIVRMLDTPS